MTNPVVSISFHLWDWKIAIILIICSTLAFFYGSLPGNEHRPVGDFMRVIFWPLTSVYLIAVVLHGLGLF